MENTDNKNTSSIFEGIDEEIEESHQSQPSDKDKEIEEINMNVQPQLGKWASWRKKRNLQSIARRDAKAIAKQQKQAQKQEGTITKKQLAGNYVCAAIQGVLLVAIIAIGVTAPALVGFFAGVVTPFYGLAFGTFVRDAYHKRKEYKKQHPKIEKEKKEKEKKTRWFKRLTSRLSKSKDKEKNSNEPVIEEETIENSQPIESMNDEQQNLSNQTSSEETVADYTLEKNSPKVESIDLSNINTTPGLNIVPHHFIVRKDDKIMNEMVAQYIEKQTGTSAMYSDQTIDGEEKRVYMLK